MAVRGIGLAFALVLLNLLMFLSIAAIYHFRQAKSVAAAEIRLRNLHLMAQAAYGLSTESSDGGEIPASSGAPRIDAWGTAYGYCAWDNGATNSSTNRLIGDNPGSDSSMVFALISAGPDRQFVTTCANIKAGTVNGDDIVQTYTIAQLRQGLPLDAYQGVPAANGAALSALNTSGILTGQMRAQNDTSELMSWTGSGWSEVVTNGGSGGISQYNRLKNYFINGDMMVIQRGSSFSANLGVNAGTAILKTADHWRVTFTNDWGGGSVNVNIYDSYSSWGNWPTSIQMIDIQPAFNTSDSATYFSLEQPVEGVSRLAGKTLTLSMYSRASSPNTNQVWVTQNFGTGGSPSTPITTKVGTISVPGSWGRTSVTFTMPAIPAGTVFGTNGDDYTLVGIRGYVSNLDYDYTLLQLEDGSQVTPFEYLNFGLELALCQRYFESGDTSATSTENYATYYWPVTGTLARGIKLRVPKRATPTVTIKAKTGGAVTVSNISTTGFTASQSVGSTGVFNSAIGWQADADW